ncbi:response regulator [Mycobacterium camsae]|uniref:response regulator n=1 Tax=Mycobacterium gordonae TaxID=1778 RepID=UPI00197E8731|nr:response regulator [Mycobacterium gordonae]
MQVLLVEDEKAIRTLFANHCSAQGVDITIASSLGEAKQIIDQDNQDFDLGICDLKIPSAPGVVDEDVQHGLAVLRHLLSVWPGVPLIVLSAFGTVDVVSKMLYDARSLDLYGDRDPRPMLRFVQKARLVDAVAAIDEVNAEIEALEQIELVSPSLTPAYCRAVRVFARRKAGTFVEYTPLAGGRSGAQTGLATVKNAWGAQVAHVVTKLTRLDRATEEKGRYISHISGKLGAATFADLGDEVMAGCGGSAGLFYSVADTFNRNLFWVLANDPGNVEGVIDELAAMCAPWLTGVPHTAKKWSDVRRNLIADSRYTDVRTSYEIVEIADEKAVQCLWTSQHGDLHGANVLINDKSRPVLIDYGRTGDAPSVLDPLTLELSAIFHPDSPVAADPWPTVDDLQNWADVDVYVRDCPYPAFVRACRSWATSVKVGQRDLFATVSAFCLRNLQYDDVDKDKALALQRVASAYVNEA